MELINDIIWWATYNSEAAALGAAGVAWAAWCTGYTIYHIKQLNKKYPKADREHIKSLGKDST
ncbi:MAG: hypothetical protein V3V26_00705 [Candidatus Aenigmarchaeota archaeon]